MEWSPWGMLAAFIFAVWIIADRIYRIGKMLEYWLPLIHRELEKLTSGR